MMRPAAAAAAAAAAAEAEVLVVLQQEMCPVVDKKLALKPEGVQSTH